MTQTIYALSSGAGPAGVAVIRLSGPDAGPALLRLTGRDALPVARRALLSALKSPDGGERIDDGLSYFISEWAQTNAYDPRKKSS